MLNLDSIVAAVASAKKYRALCDATIGRVAERERAAQPGADLKTVVKATKRRLHQVYGAFEQQVDYEAAWLGLHAAYTGGADAEIRVGCRHVMRLHHSTRERLPILDRFYADLWAVTGKPRSILDLGCGLNPLSLPWMGLEAGCRYIPLDIDRERIHFLNRYLILAGLSPLARCQDVLVRPPDDPVDVALLLKMSPTLERQEPGATARLLEALPAAWAAVSFAVKSLGGREKGMPATYQQGFLALAETRRWAVTRLGFGSELVFVVQCNQPRPWQEARQGCRPSS
jgi:16S rRNA (guanine(1405)-N(7))-methyltransferase